MWVSLVGFLRLGSGDFGGASVLLSDALIFGLSINDYIFKNGNSEVRRLICFGKVL